MGDALNGTGKYDEAIEVFDRAIEIDPQYMDAWKKKGNSLRAYLKIQIISTIG